MSGFALRKREREGGARLNMDFGGGDGVEGEKELSILQERRRRLFRRHCPLSLSPSP